MNVSDNLVDEFNENGFIKIPNFFDFESEILPIQNEIKEVIELIRKKMNIGVDAPLNNFDDVNFFFNGLKISNKEAGAMIYDAMKHLISLYTIIANKKIINFLGEIWPNGMPKVAACGAGIRINHPNEPQFSAPWHQEIHYQGRSSKGAVLWIPLVSVNKELGPVNICPKSHRNGALKVHRDLNPDTIYDVEITNIEKIVDKYSIVSPVSEPGDAIFIDFLTLHSSGINLANRSLWSIQIRYFNMLDKKGFDISWGGPTIRRADPEKLFPELFL